MNEDDMKKFDEFNSRIHKEIKEIIEKLLKEYTFVKKVKYKLIIDM